MSEISREDLERFEKYAWPYAQHAIGGWSEMVSIQNAKRDELRMFDLFGGCDLLCLGGEVPFGVAVRVNNNPDFFTFTFGFTEFRKRMAAIRRRLNQPNSSPIFPEYTMQATIAHGCEYRACAVVRTWDLYHHITMGFRSDIPMIQMKQGKEKPFWCIDFADVAKLTPVWMHQVGDAQKGLQFI